MSKSGERPVPPKRLTAQRRREQLLEEAARIFSKRGYAGARIRDIAAACGVTEAVLYKHFESKDELFRAALDARIASHDIKGFLAGLPADLPILETFRRVAAEILEVGMSDPIIHKLLLAATLSGTNETQTLYVTWRIPFVKHIEAVVAAGIARGELREVNPLLTARAFVGLVMDCVLSCNIWIEMGQPTAKPDALIQNNVPTFVFGLSKQQEKK